MLKNVRQSRVGGQTVRDADVAVPVGFWPELQFRKRHGMKKDDTREREREGGRGRELTGEERKDT
jgi:hypothetical protein